MSVVQKVAAGPWGSQEAECGVAPRHDVLIFLRWTPDGNTQPVVPHGNVM